METCPVNRLGLPSIPLKAFALHPTVSPLYTLLDSNISFLFYSITLLYYSTISLYYMYHSIILLF